MKTVKHPRLTKRAAATTLHAHRCIVCGRLFQVRNRECDRRTVGYACAAYCGGSECLMA